MEKMSIVVPCYNEEEAIPIFYEALKKEAEALPDIELEIIYVNDGSRDRSLEEMKKLAAQDSCVHYVGLSRNFGKESAMFAGLSYATGDYVAIMDVDLQDPPALLPKMLKGIREEGYDCVATRRVNRIGEPPIRSFFARQFYKLMNHISKTDIVDGARDFRFMTRDFVNALLELKEYNRFSKGLFGWVGFETKWLEYENIERVAGETKWNFFKLLLYSFEGITAFSTVPLALSSVAGIVLCIVAFLALIVIIGKTLIWGDPVAGWPSLACLIVFTAGVQLLCVGILGQYLSKTYLEVKGRPVYIIKEKNTDRTE
jgi:glycosyltransferase involved in cell wall biosynthesis